jgi:hypothetical protein
MAGAESLEEIKKEAFRWRGLENAGEVVAAPGAVVGRAEIDEETTGDAGHRRDRSKPCARELGSIDL